MGILDLFKLDGKVAIVTGASSGLGVAFAKAMAEAGADVAIGARRVDKLQDTVQLIEGAGRRGLAVRTDITVVEDCQALVDAAMAEFGRVDILVNNAGIAHVGTIERTTEADFDRLYAVNVKGVYLCARAAVPIMLKQGGGVILNMASIASLVGVPERFAYSMTKGAVHTMTMSIAIDYVKQNIRCNCICPARIHTPFVDAFVARHYAGRERETLAQLAAYQPIGRMGTSEEVAHLALYLCSDEAAFVTGQAYPIDGGVLVA
jgi:2-keto-3-deoxy-L-fuconate dehydrogenase